MDSHATPAAGTLNRLDLDNRLPMLGERFGSRVAPTPLTAPRLLHLNTDVAIQLGLDPEQLCTDPEAIEVLAGNRELPGGHPFAAVYAGHQFGGWVPQLGDGRAILIGQVRTPEGRRWDLQLKGAGRTPYSRFGDGRAVIRSTVREYLAGEALHHLGIPTTRALAIVVADDPVRRETIERAAVLSRVAPSHVRFGNFEYFYSLHDTDALATLADHVIDDHFPELSAAPDRVARWLEAVTARTAELIANWQAVGFCHGVMNTDNMSVLGLTLDYGPYGFLDAFDAGHVCNHSDPGGRYAYDRQPQIGHWNCSRLIQSCVPLLSGSLDHAAEIGQSILDRYPGIYAARMTALWREKFGLQQARDDDPELINRFLSLLHRTHADFTCSLRALSAVARDDDRIPRALAEQIVDHDALNSWLADYRRRLASEAADGPRAERMNRRNPKLVLRNHLAQAAIEAAENGDAGEIERLLALLRRPYDEHPDAPGYCTPPPPEAAHISVSCSS